MSTQEGSQAVAFAQLHYDEMHLEIGTSRNKVADLNCQPNDKLCHQYGRLFAAAPDLLEACKAVMEEFDDRYDGAPDGGCKWMASLMHTLEAAVAKAERP